MDMGLFDLVVFFAMQISLVVFVVGFAFGFFCIALPNSLVLSFFISFFFKVALVYVGLCP